MSVQADIINSHPYTKFPTEVDNFDRKIDVSLELVSLVDQYYVLYNQHKFDEMNTLLEENPRLKLCVHTAEDDNRLIDGLLATQELVLTYLNQYLIEFVQPKGEWNPSAKYTKYNVVTYEYQNATQTYIAMKVDIPIGTLPTDINYWTCLTMRGEKGDSGTGLTVRLKYDYESTYYKDDFVVHNNAFWAAKQENFHQIPNDASSSWECLMKFSSDLLIYNNNSSSLNGTTFQSAMDELSNKVDRAIALKTVTVPASGWSEEPPYRQSVIVENVSETDEPIIANYILDIQNKTPEQIKAEQKAYGYFYSGGGQAVTNNGSITFTTYIKKPASDFTIIMKG